MTDDIHTPPPLPGEPMPGRPARPLAPASDESDTLAASAGGAEVAGTAADGPVASGAAAPSPNGPAGPEAFFVTPAATGPAVAAPISAVATDASAAPVTPAAPPASGPGGPTGYATPSGAGAAAAEPEAGAERLTSGESRGPAYMKRSETPWSILSGIFRARAKALFNRASQRITQRTLHIGVSARIFHPEPDGKGLRGKTLQYLEESIAHWVMSRDVIVFMIPTVAQQGMLHYGNIRLRDYARHLDGLVLQGGADVSPQSYSQQATRPEWTGDRVRDMYELELMHEFVEAGKPVLGVCRGCQLINVAFGGSLYQDIATDVPQALAHVTEVYDSHRHLIRFPSGSSLAGMFAGRSEALVNSIHHQAVKTLGRDLSVEAVSAEDGIVEAIRYRNAPFVMGVQWHPEFHRAGGAELLDCTPLLDNFLRAARETRF